MKGFFRKLRQRNVIKVGIAYLVIAWAVMQLADVILPLLQLPEWTITLVLALLVLGFPIALVLAWAYEITPDGIQRDDRDAITTKPLKAIETSVGVEDKSIAVLPFANLSADEEQEHFCDGLTEELLNVLAGLPGLRVASRTSSFAFKNKSVGLATVGEKLQVAHILEGSVRKSGSSIRITAQLIDVTTDSHLWSETYDRQLDDIFAIQDDIARRILGALKLKLVSVQPDYNTTENSKAYEYFLRGCGYANTKGSKDEKLAIKLFQQAVALDPGFVRAWVKLAETSALFAMFSTGGKRSQEIATEASDNAIKLAPDYVNSHMARGNAYLASKQYAEAEAAFFKAIDLDPGLGLAYHYLARSAYFQGQMGKALEYFNKSMELDPDDYESPLIASGIYVKFNDPENEKRLAKIGVKRAKRHLEDYPDNHRAYYLGVSGLLVLGEIERAKKWAERAYQIAPEDTATRYNLACFYTRIGDYDKALDFLENSISSRRWIANDPDLEPLHSNPRFQAVLDALPE
ncbi:MAG: tetratricopeptide repeat protein [Proteobacteria bacterium]|nr:tetratricopeptide repeat protein [Pseudomonadota bacterium]